MTPTEVSAGNTTEVTDVAIDTRNGSSVNPTTTTGLSSPTPVNSGTFVKVVSEVPLSPDKNGSEQCDVWLPLASIHEVNDRMKNSMYGYFVGKRLAFPVVEWFMRNNWEKYGLNKVTMVKDFFFLKFSSIEGVDSVLRDGPWMIHEILIFLNKWSSSDNLVMAVPNIEGTRYTKETIRVEYEWKPPRCSMCLLFGHSLDDCPKAAPNRVENRMDKGKPKTQYRPKAKQSTARTCNSPKMAHPTGTNKASISGYNKESPINNGNVFSMSNSFEALNVDDPIIKEVPMGSKLVLVDDDGKSLEKIDYPDNSDSDDEVEPVKNETASFLASKGVGYGLKTL
uniref:DUF4283 domain-containing protein n=1 Tax=Tanacetum cinerariifolium TaxID=118510 RepID=A0A6L2MLK6_TANCI|nr:hypothetical protein [Tanacetum cinerariifolium]